MIVKKIAGVASAAQVPSAFASEGVEYQKIGVCNWPSEFPYAPSVEFGVAHSGDTIYIHYKVSEKTTGAAAGEDLGRVWEDSCVEFFCCPEAESSFYYNIECNCIGTILVCGGPGRHDREKASAEVLAGVQRWSSLGREPFAEREEGPWEVALVIPAGTFFKHSVGDLGGAKMRANFYKCGDLLQTPHFLSYAPIAVANPDFHRPEFFTAIDFE